jgi:DNA-binding transcriptional MocR family regulator
MHHFYDGHTATNQLRFSCSALGAEEIDEGLDRFAGFVADSMN